MRLFAVLILAAAGGSNMDITSSAFAAGESIPKEFTCEGADAVPPLQISGVPSGTKSLALVVHDPDAPDPAAPQRDWVHWVVYGMPPGTRAIEGGKLPSGARTGKNDFGKTNWGGPCPPTGRHRYFFEVYALDAELPDLHTPTRGALDKAMQGHIVAKAQLMGTYEKGG